MIGIIRENTNNIIIDQLIKLITAWRCNANMMPIITLIINSTSIRTNLNSAVLESDLYVLGAMWLTNVIICHQSYGPLAHLFEAMIAYYSYNIALICLLLYIVTDLKSLRCHYATFSRIMLFWLPTTYPLRLMGVSRNTAPKNDVILRKTSIMFAQ